jgi:hypothetical protein
VANEISKELREHLTKLGAKGGRSRSQAKRLAAQANQVKAVAARWRDRRGQVQ